MDSTKISFLRELLASKSERVKPSSSNAGEDTQGETTWWCVIRKAHPKDSHTKTFLGLYKCVSY